MPAILAVLQVLPLLVITLSLLAISECCTPLSDFHTASHIQELECQTLSRVITNPAWIGSTYQCRSV